MNRFVQDDDGHWYYIPTKLLDDFHDWLESLEDDLKFEDYRCSHPSCYDVVIQVRLSEDNHKGTLDKKGMVWQGEGENV